MMHHHERRTRAVRGISFSTGTALRLAGISVAVTSLTLSSVLPANAATAFAVSTPSATPSASEPVAVTITSPDAPAPDETADAVAPVESTEPTDTDVDPAEPTDDPEVPA